MIVHKIMEGLKNNFPNSTIKINIVREPYEYVEEGLAEFILDDKIRFLNLIYNYNNETDENVNFCVEKISRTIQKQYDIFERENKKYIINEKKVITFMDMAKPISFHKLNDKEFDKKIKEYNIKKEELEWWFMSF